MAHQVFTPYSVRPIIESETETSSFENLTYICKLIFKLKN